MSTATHDDKHVNQICRILSDFRNPKDDLQEALTPFTATLTPDLVDDVLKRCKHLPYSAHRFFVWAQSTPSFKPSPKAHPILIDILGTAQHFPLLWDFISYIHTAPSSFQLTPQLFSIVFRAYSRAQLPAGAVRAFTRMPEFGIQPERSDLNTLLHTLCKRNHAAHAHQFFNSIKSNFHPSSKTYAILIHGLGRNRDSHTARKLYDEMLDSGCHLEVPACNALLWSLCRAGSVDEARSILNGMRSIGLEPDPCTYSIFIRTYCEANDAGSTFTVLDTMKRHGLSPNIYTYNCIVKMLCKIERIHDAYALLDEMSERGVSPDVWSYNAIQAYHCTRFEVNCAVRLVDRMRKENCAPDRHTYNMVLKMLIRVGRFDRMVKIWDVMEDGGFYPSVSTYSVMVHGLVMKRGKLNEACEYFERMIDEGLPPYVCTVELLRDRLLGFGLLEQLHAVADKMERSTCCSIKELSATMRGRNERPEEMHIKK